MNFPETKFKNDSSRKQFLTKRGVRFQKDENGVEGVATARDGEDEKEIKIGKRLSADKVKVQDFGDGTEFGPDALQQAHARHSRGLAVECNTQARVSPVDWMLGVRLGLG